jgi:broad specificity phosphatase PhoE
MRGPQGVWPQTHFYATVLTMATLYLIRHALTDVTGKAIAGLAPGLHLNEQGRAQALELAQKLGEKGITRIYSSPLDRARETAQPLADRLNLPVQILESLTDLFPGEWTGKSFVELQADPRFRAFNDFRSGTRVPGGELMLEAQLRMVAELLCLRDRHPGESIAVVSHADPIRAALAFFLGMPLDFYRRMEISPASYSRLELEEWGPMVGGMNVV